MYYRSALKVEELAGSLKRLSIFLGMVVGLIFLASVFSFLYHSNYTTDAVQAAA